MGIKSLLQYKKDTTVQTYEYLYLKENDYYTNESYGHREKPIQIIFIDYKFSETILPFDQPYTLQQLKVLSALSVEIESLENKLNE